MHLTRGTLPAKVVDMHTTRRQFCTQIASSLLTAPILAQDNLAGTSTRPNVAVIDRDRILSSADHFLTLAPTPITTFPATHSPGSTQDYYSEPEDISNAFVAHRDAILTLAHIVPTLTSAYVLTKDERYSHQAMAHLHAWFVSPETSMKPDLEFAQVIPPAKLGRPTGLMEAVHLAEVAQSVPFLANSEIFSSEDLESITEWFTKYLDWLNNSRNAGLARDSRDHNGSSWLLQAAACARMNIKDDRALTALRHQFHNSTIRAQITFDGSFPRELTTPDPYRNSLFNLDMLAGCCELLSTRFENVWNYELQDGPGMRVAVARLFPFIARRSSWPYKADSAFFNELPLRRPALLFAARAYSRPEYADLWRSLPADSSNAELDRTFPIREPLLWVTRPRP